MVNNLTNGLSHHVGALEKAAFSVEPFQDLSDEQLNSLAIQINLGIDKAMDVLEDQYRQYLLALGFWGTDAILYSNLTRNYLSNEDFLANVKEAAVLATCQLTLRDGWGKSRSVVSQLS
jgi:hypothetical protein